jgi:putative ABC transport system permease protein
MIRNYFLVTLRNLQRNSIYTFINIAGLSVGLASSMLIMLWIYDEISFDKFHKNYNNLYQVYQNQEYAGNIGTSETVPYPLLDALRAKSTSIKNLAIITNPEGFSLGAGETKINRMAGSVSEDFLKMFTFDMLHGSADKALDDLSSIVLTESTAKILFGHTDVLNKLVRLDNRADMKVTGVLKDLPVNSTFQFDFLIPFSYRVSTEEWIRNSEQNWRNNSFRIFVLLAPGASASLVNAEVASLIKDNNPKAPTSEVFLHAMADWHLYSEFTNGKISGGMIEYVRLFTAIAVFILIIACINFMNLATARSEGRAREVGVRKTVGSRRSQLIAQFLGESIIISFIAFIIAIVIVELTLPLFNLMVNKQLHIDYKEPMLWAAVATLVLVTGIIAGSYPAFYLSAFSPVKVLKGSVRGGNASVTPRKILVMAQFAFSIFLVIGAIVIYEQIMHVKARKIGYDRENLLLIWSTSDIEKNFRSIKDELKQSGVVKEVCKSSAPITRIFSSADDVSWPGKVTDDKVSFVTIATEYDYTETMGIKMLAGRDFSPDFVSDSSAIVINQSALELMNLEDPIGQKIRIWESERTIIGVMEDVVMGSPYHPVAPLAMVLIPDWSSTISIRLNATSELNQAVAKVEQIFKKYDPEHPIAYRFADHEFDTKFTSLNLVSRIAWSFTILAIAISCLGLFGLAAFAAEQRTKEVGIRKVLGASVANLVMLMTRDFSKLVILSFAIAAPCAWWLMNAYLEQYPYRTEVSWWVMLLAGAGALIIAVIIVSTQALRTAVSNPVNALRSE